MRCAHNEPAKGVVACSEAIESALQGGEDQRAARRHTKRDLTLTASRPPSMTSTGGSTSSLDAMRSSSSLMSPAPTAALVWKVLTGTSQRRTLRAAVLGMPLSPTRKTSPSFESNSSAKAAVSLPTQSMA